MTAIALAVCSTLAAGVISALAIGADGPGGGRGEAAGDAETVQAPTGAGGSGEPGASGPVARISDSGQVAPLRRVVPPDVLAVGKRRITPAQARRIARLGRVQDVMVVAGGAVQLQGRSIQTFAVDPSAFRSWTPPGTARKNELWTALAKNQFVVSQRAAGQLKLRRGDQYPVVARSMPTVTMGGSGSLGLPGVDMLVSKTTGEDMGLIPDLVVLVNAPGGDPGKLSTGMRRVLGGGSQVLNLHEKGNQVPADQPGGPVSYLDLYKKAAATCPGLSWTVLAAIGQVESDHGRNVGPSTAGALGPMQFLPATWNSYGVDGDGDGKADIMNPYDAIPGAARYLCASGAGRGGQALYNAVFAYNHAHWYVQRVLALARAYATRYS